MNITENFLLITGAPNILNMSKNEINKFTLEGNSPKHVYVALELKKNQIRHPSRDKILEYVKNVKVTKDLDVLVLDQYPLVSSYNRKTNSKIINIAPFNTKELGRVSYNNLFASVLYAYTFEKLVTGKLRIPDNLVQPISNFWFSFFVQIFGRDYGMTGTYSSKLPGLKFMLTLYILVAFFGRKQDRSSYNLAKQYSGYYFDEKLDVLNKLDISNIRGLISGLNLMEIMPGFNIIKFTTKVHQMFDVQMLPMFEDLSRFLTTVVVANFGGQTIAKPFLSKKYNTKAFIQILQYIEKRLF